MGCCGSNQGPSMEYEVTFRDGSLKRFTTKSEARIAAAQDTSKGSVQPQVRAVAKK